MKLTSGMAVILAFTIGMVLWQGCSMEKEKFPLASEAETFEIVPYRIPVRINLQRVQCYVVEVKIQHPSGPAAIDSARAFLYGSDGTTLILDFPLYDDGSGPFGCRPDVIAHDGIFTGNFNSDSTLFPAGKIYFRFQAWDKSGQTRLSELTESMALFNQPPVVVSTLWPDSVRAGLSPTFFQAIVQDSNGTEDIASVAFQLKQADTLVASYAMELDEEISVDSARYQLLVDSTFAAGRKGWYVVEVAAEDLSQAQNRSPADSLYLENTPPLLSNPGLPDTIQKPTSGVDTIRVFIHAKDSQGLVDIFRVYFTVTLIGGTTSNAIDMFDDGNFPEHSDEVAGDGIFSRGITIASTNQAGTYVFDFFAVDKVGQMAVSLSDTMVVQE